MKPNKYFINFEGIIEISNQEIIENGIKKTFKLTDKGNKLLSEIYGKNNLDSKKLKFLMKKVYLLTDRKKEEVEEILIKENIDPSLYELCSINDFKEKHGLKPKKGSYKNIFYLILISIFISSIILLILFEIDLYIILAASLFIILSTAILIAKNMKKTDKNMIPESNEIKSPILISNHEKKQIAQDNSDMQFNIEENDPLGNKLGKFAIV